MKRSCAAALACALLAAAGPAAPQAPAPPSSAGQPAENPAKERKRLDLRLDPIDQPRPRVTFEPREAAKPEAAGGLPELGGRPARSFDTPSDAATSPYPKDTNPGR